jgi:hypothetical protein
VISKTGKFNKPGSGIAFVLPVDHICGLESQMSTFKDQARDEYF